MKLGVTDLSLRNQEHTTEDDVVHNREGVLVTSLVKK